jgi:hypothetical protein
LGPVIALGLLLAVRGVQRFSDWRTRHRHPRRVRSRRLAVTRWLGITTDTARGPFWPVAAATAVPLALYAYVNYAKFGTLISAPYQKQDILAKLSPERKASLVATNNHLFGLQYLPTNLLEYFRPDGIGFRQTFPWVTFAAKHSLNGLAFDPLEPTASMTTTAVCLCVLAVLGVVAAVRARNADDERLDESLSSPARFRIPILSAAVVIAGTSMIAAYAFRYEGDFLPLLIAAGALGLYWLGTVLARSPRWLTATVATALVITAVWSCWTIFGLALINQREYNGFQSPAVRAGFFGFQLDVNESLGLGPPTFQRGQRLPLVPGPEIRRTNAPHGKLFVVGDCAGLYISDGRAWEPIEEKFPGQRRWLVSFGDPRPGERQPLWSAGTGPYEIIWARWLDQSHVRLEYQWTGAPRAEIQSGATLSVAPGDTYALDVRLDPVSRYLEVKRGAKTLLAGSAASFATTTNSHLGSQPDPHFGATRWRGQATERSLTPLCDRLTSAA